MRITRILGSLVIAGVLATGTIACAGASEQAGGGGPCDVKVSTDLAKKPDITVPECDPPKALETRDIVAGTGAAAKAGDAVKVKYVGISWSTRQQFDASWERNDTFTVQPLGQAGVIKGWNQGLIGATKGSRRLLVIPPNLGYGAQVKTKIKANETLVFVVDVVSINGQ